MDSQKFRGKSDDRSWSLLLNVPHSWMTRRKRCWRPWGWSTCQYLQYLDTPNVCNTQCVTKRAALTCENPWERVTGLSRLKQCYANPPKCESMHLQLLLLFFKDSKRSAQLFSQDIWCVWKCNYFLWMQDGLKFFFRCQDRVWGQINRW